MPADCCFSFEVSFPLLLAFACRATVWGLGELIGSWMGRHQVIPFLWVAEVKAVTQAAVALCDALEAK
ncbi:MAG: hypothetical protein FJX89_03585 [Bacteroidetes bacterium]|nr:hypothetical protein [Bacteroidota bacterium]